MSDSGLQIGDKYYRPGTIQPDAEEEASTGSRRLDPELRTMGAMLRMLDDLDDKARARVVSYLSSRYQEKP